MRLVAWPTSGLSGRVVDADGDPVGRVQVLALRIIYRGGKQETTIAQTVMTDDRGDYRMFWLTPGSYRVAARQWDAEGGAPAVNIGPPRRFGTVQQGTTPLVSRRTLPDGTVVEETDVPIYAPATPDPQLATTVVLAPGDSATDVDIQLAGNRVRAHHLRGVVIAPGAQPGRLQLLVVPRTTSPFVTVASAASRVDGSFDVGGVAPGSYVLYSQEGTFTNASAALPIDVGEADVDNIALTIPASISLNARVTIDRDTGNTARADLSNLHVQLTRDPDYIGAPVGGPRMNPAPSQDWTMALSGLSPGDYRVGLTPMRRREADEDRVGPPAAAGLENAFVKSIRLGSADVLADGLHIAGPTSSTLDIVVSLDGAEVEGDALDGSRTPIANVTVVAIPDAARRGRADSYRRAITDGRGHFSLQGLAPGDYTVYAWDDIERGAWESPEFMRAFEGRGRFVRLHEGRNDALELSVMTGR